ncbi:MAG: hypothetical protein ACHQX1_00080 [Candidatus Micrarchaeales archaeon]
MATDFEELREKMLQSAKEGITEAYSSEEYALIQAINAHLETSKSYNLVYERLTEWAGIYFPEIRFTNPRTLSEFALLVTKNKIDYESLYKIINDEKQAKFIHEKAKSTIGRKMNDDERKAIAGFAEMGNNMSDALVVLETYLKIASNRMLPNTTYLTDEKIAAELLSKAGSMERLATMPASTIQLLGAEKSLFKHLKYGSKPPKYGVLFKMTAVNGAQRDIRGRIARVYATKISIALKADHYTKNFIAKELKKSLDESIEKIKAAPIKEKKHSNNERPNPNFKRPFNRQNEGGHSHGGFGKQQRNRHKR